MKVAQLCPTLCNLMNYTVRGILQARILKWSFPSPGIFPTQGLNPGLLHCRWILYQLNHKGSPRIMEWVAYPFSSRSSQSRNQTESPVFQADSLPTELSGKPLVWKSVTISFNSSVLFWPFLEYNICCSHSFIKYSSSSHFEFGNTIQLNTKRNQKYQN